MCNNPFTSADWTDQSLRDTWQIVRDIAVNEFKLDFYEPYFEICTFEEMLQIYTTGFPVMFNHWSFGKSYESLYRSYKNNQTSIAYEVIFNTNPALCYLLENNTSVMQALVMAHAAVGHSAFFKMNEFTRENTNAKTILPFMRNMRSFVTECEQKYGEKRVEEILDVCCSLSLYAVDKAEKVIVSNKDADRKNLARASAKEREFDPMVEELLSSDLVSTLKPTNQRPKEENILKFIARYSPSLKQWERDIINMYCKVEQYFYPQRLTKMMNEGFASFWHYQIMNRLYDLGHLDDGQVLEFLHSHTGVLCQRDHDERGYSGLNPYKLGYEIFNDIKRICTEPTEEDKRDFPHLIGKNWVEEVNYAAANFRDPSFVLQYLSRKVVRDFKLFKIKDDSDQSHFEITSVHDDDDFNEIRKSLEEQYNFYNNIPNISVEGASLKGTRTLFLKAVEDKDQWIDEQGLHDTMVLMKKLWAFPINLKYTSFKGEEASVTI